MLGRSGRSGIDGRPGVLVDGFDVVEPFGVEPLVPPGPLVPPVPLVIGGIEPGAPDDAAGPLAWTSFCPAVPAAFAQPTPAPMLRAPRAATAASRLTRRSLSSVPSPSIGRDGAGLSPSARAPLVRGAVGDAAGREDGVVGGL